MGRVVWSPAARGDLQEILGFFATQDADYARWLTRQLELASDRLGDYPTGRPGRITGTFEKSLPKLRYILVYRVERGEAAHAVTILRVIHTARDWRPGRWPE